ncbi:MAG: hypothetical protein ABSF79_12220, partial [Smithellaceae bacterium]
VSIALPPPIVFAAPPELVVIPETNVYAVPDVDVDIFFYSGWWWRPWEGRWYRSRNYNSGWGYYGEGINGTINEYPTNKSNGTGATGRRTDIGRSKTLGVSKVCNPERDHNSRLERFNKNLRQNCNLERQPNRDKRDPNLKRLNRNLERQPNHNNLNLNRGNLKEARKKNRIESRMTKGSPDIV